MMDWNKFAAEITKFEGKKKSLSIAQVKEVLRIVACVAASEPDFLQALFLYGVDCLALEHINEHGKQTAKESKKSPKRKAPKCKKK